MHKITRAVNMCQNLQPRLSTMSGISHEVIDILEIIIATFVATLATFSLRISVYLGGSGKEF